MRKRKQREMDRNAMADLIIEYREAGRTKGLNHTTRWPLPPPYNGRGQADRLDRELNRVWRDGFAEGQALRAAEIKREAKKLVATRWAANTPDDEFTDPDLST